MLLRVVGGGGGGGGETGTTGRYSPSCQESEL